MYRTGSMFLFIIVRRYKFINIRSYPDFLALTCAYSNNGLDLGFPDARPPMSLSTGVYNMHDI